MQRTARDLQKLADGSIHIAKKALYYGYIPLILFLGARTVRLDMLMGQGQPM